jgi:hypothetical protein
MTRFDTRGGDSPRVLDACRDLIHAVDGEELGSARPTGCMSPSLSVVASRSQITIDTSGIARVIVCGGETTTMAPGS